MPMKRALLGGLANERLTTVRGNEVAYGGDGSQRSVEHPINSY